MSQATCTLSKVISGRDYYAKVTVEVTEDSGKAQVWVSQSAFDWLKDLYGLGAWEWPVCDEWRKAAKCGAEFALSRLPRAGTCRDVTVQVMMIHGTLVHATPAAVGFATSQAIFQALGAPTDAAPRTQDGKLVFPGV